jgi:NTP pyrophosphatase (non-canonical NTP hydrolase)
VALFTFDILRAANVARIPLFKNRYGKPAHSKPDGSDWSLGEWCNAVTGELGEAANLIKKFQRGDLCEDELRDLLRDELADVVTYVDLLAYRAGIDLGEATRSKWNRVSQRVGCDLRID